jgi:sugar lactone lactonase YvrE
VTSPRGIAIDSDGNIYVADAEFTDRPGAPVPLRSGRIRKIATNGTVSTIAGTGAEPDKDDIPALEARLGSCSGLAIDNAGNLYVAEVERNRVRRIAKDGTIRTIAGTGNGGFGFGPPAADVGDGGPATKATLRAPTDVTIDKDGGLLIAEWQNYRIRRVDRDGIIRTVAGGGRGPLDEGKASEMDLDGPSGVAAAPDGSFYLFDWYVITRVTPDGEAKMVTNWSPAGDVAEGGPASQAYVAGALELSGMAVDAAGNLFLVDARRSRVRRIGTDGTITTVAGTMPFRFAGDGGQAMDALLNTPAVITTSGDGNIYVLERDNCRVRRIGPDSVIQTVAGNGVCGISGPDADSATEVAIGLANGLTADARGNLYLAEIGSIRQISPNGNIKTIVNNRNGAPGTFGDITGPALDARVRGPINGLYVDRDGNLYFTDGSSNRIRKVTPDGMISTFAGSSKAPGPAFSGDDGPALQAELSNPSALTGDAAGNIYVLDTGNGRIRKIDADGIITTIAGNGRSGYGGDSGPALEASFRPFGPAGPSSIAVDSSKNLYIADQGNQRIRRIGADGIITTVAGTGEAGFSAEDGKPDQAKLNNPAGLAIDTAGNLYVADSGNHRIRKIALPVD